MANINEFTITGKTKVLCLFGSPVAHSISPMMHNEAFKLLDIDYRYFCFDVDENNLEQAFAAMRLFDFRGCNCTMPDKNRAYELVDKLSPEANIIGACNTIVNDNGILTGHNTDGKGYMLSAKDAGFDLTGSTMTLMGAGGAATAIAVQAAFDGVKNINIFSIKDQFWGRAEKLVKEINANTNCNAKLFEFNDDDLRESIKDSDILTNATSVGMAPNVDGCLIKDKSMLRPDLIVSDIIYNPRKTKLITMAEEVGCKTFNGMYMLLYQGAEAFKIWTGEDMPTEEIKKKYFS
ncbi:shikimate dehydrogenase [Eubacterium sp.]|uniref:shikimate dehydrogenase n=1 Tax=Eubacterium sp. TaxID=142586 RepID=UPI0025E23F41|nr:shikimate dehydrogenase [Eubacterium sp.]MCR5628477.1 shikimate dehydrogenase [Eubacterium sp.]